MQVAWDVKYQINALQEPGEGYEPIELAGSLIDARIALWLLNPDMAGITDAHDLSNKEKVRCN